MKILTLIISLSASLFSGLVSPTDGTVSTSDTLIFISSAGGDKEIMRVDSDGANLTNLTNNSASDFAPAYSPTAKKVVFVSNRTGTNQIFVMNLDGSNQTNLSNSPETEDTSPSWSPDGTKIVFVRNPGSYFGIWVMNADGSNQSFNFIGADDADTRAVYSPDGSQIAFRYQGHLTTASPFGGNYFYFGYGTDANTSVSWSPDGSKILYDKPEKGGVRQIYTINAFNGQVETPLTSSEAYAAMPRWSPDGSKIAFSLLFEPDAYRVHTMNADGSNEQEITSSASPAHTYNFPEWSPTGSRVGFTGDYEIGGNAYSGLGTVNADGTGPMFLATADTDKPILWFDLTELPAIRFSRAGSLDFESYEFADLERQIRILRTGDLSASSEIDYATADGTAIAGDDYTATSGTLNFAPGESLKVITIPILDDTIVEADETFSLTLSNPSGGTLAGVSTETVSIYNDDAQYELHKESLNQTVSESASAQFRITRFGYLYETGITFSTTDGTATAPDDYSAVSTTVNFGPTQTEALVTVPLNNDNLDEPNEFFTATLSNPPFGGSLGPNFTTNLNIVDDDVTYTLESAAYPVLESAGSIAVKIIRNDTTEATAVSYATGNGTAVQPDDYTETTGTVNFPIGVSEATINIPIILNLAHEADETFQFGLFNPTNGTVGTPSSAVITIIDATLTAPAPTDLVSWWTGDINTLDVRGRHHGALESGVGYTAGMAGQGFNFGGVGGVVVPNAPDLNPTAALTIESWVYPTTDSIGSNAMAIIANKEISGTVQYEMSRRLTSGSCPSGDNSIPSGNFAIYVGGISGLPDQCGGWVDGGANLPLNTWSHVAMTYDGVSLRGYVNGTLTRTVAASGTIVTTDGSFRIGSRIIVPEVWIGKVDEPAIYRRALTLLEIQKIYQARDGGKHKPTATVAPSGLVGFWSGDGDAKDTAGPNDGTLLNGAGHAIGKVGQSFKFDGVNDELLIGDAPELDVNSLTLEAWVKPNNLPNGAISDVISKWGFNGAVDSYLLSIFKTSGGTMLAFGAIGDGSSGDGGIRGLAVEIQEGEWTHIAMTYNSANGDNRLFVNGVQVGARTRPGGTFNSALKVYIGREDSVVVRRFRGLIDEASIYNRALTPDEIASVYSAGLGGKLKSDLTLSDAPNLGKSSVPEAAVTTVGDATITMPSVTTGGTTQEIPLDPSLFPPLPFGVHTGLIYDISTAAVYSGSASICFKLPAFTQMQSQDLRVLHFVKNAWVNVTAPDMSAHPTLCTQPVSSLSPFAIVVFAPSAASASVGGRVVDPSGHGIANARVLLEDTLGSSPRSALTNPFGYFTFESVEVSQLYVLSVSHKRYQFAPRTVIVNDNVTDLEIVATP